MICVMKSTFTSSNALLLVVVILGLMVASQSVPVSTDLGGDTKTSAKPHFKIEILTSENNALHGIPDVKLEEIEAAFLLGKDAYGPYEATEEAATPVIAKAPKVAPKYQPIIPNGNPKIAIIIDDMGVSRSNSQKTIDLDAPLTLAFLPYAEDLQGMTAQAAAEGHQLMIHMPMQAMTNPVSLGPIKITDDMQADAVRENMNAAFGTFDGYVGLNNHMGSKVTQNPAIMSVVMETLKDQDLFFVDSRTISTSIAAETAREYGLPVAVRDVFLDHEDTTAFVTKALRNLEAVAVRKGHAIAIGHPKKVTINALKAWLPDAQARGFEIVHVSELLERPVGVKISSKIAKVAKTEPAAGAEAKQVAQVEVEAESDVDAETATETDDPNSAAAREAILKTQLGHKD